MSEHECIMEEKIDNLTKKTDQILDAITGDKLGNKGVIPTLSEHNERLESLERYKVETKTTSKAKQGVITALISFLSAAAGIISSFLFK
jgi:hypothetical protein